MHSKNDVSIYAVVRILKELAERTGLSLPTLSRNLREMLKDGLVELRKEGKRILTQITKEGRILT
ncbi:winged helix-turn-helix transcriptional regulator [Candidatus Bathyarchaeota archaeon]|nr:winged helix-turn-helix transcriptional regulator [Candidatus Bathyarchaeota archaeon]